MPEVDDALNHEANNPTFLGLSARETEDQIGSFESTRMQKFPSWGRMFRKGDKQI